MSRRSCSSVGVFVGWMGCETGVLPWPQAVAVRAMNRRVSKGCFMFGRNFFLNVVMQRGCG